MTLAKWGSVSSICTPATLVPMALVSPPVVAPGLGLKVSNWLGPPAIQSSTQRLPRFCRSPAARATRSVQLTPCEAAVVAPTQRKKSRRDVTTRPLVETSIWCCRGMVAPGLG